MYFLDMKNKIIGMLSAKAKYIADEIGMFISTPILTRLLFSVFMASVFIINVFTRNNLVDMSNFIFVEKIINMFFERHVFVHAKLFFN